MNYIKLFKGVTSELKVLPDDQGVHDFSSVLYADDYGTIGYWKGSRSSHNNSNWVLTEDDALLFANAYPMFELLDKVLDSTELTDTSLRNEISTVLKRIVKAP